MKPKDLKIPFSWKDPQIIINDRVWYVPERIENADRFLLPDWSDPLIFGNNHPVNIEYCSGNGAWVVSKALANPMVNWIAVEKKVPRMKQIWSKLKNMRLSNLFIICGEAFFVTKNFFRENSFNEVYINFPDPWPKNRHSKHRLIQNEFISELWRVLAGGQPLTFVTDDPPYSKWLINTMNRQGGFVSSFPNPYYVTTLLEYGSSYFEQLWRSKGKEIL